MLFYLVMGETGEYEDRRDWVVCGFTTEALAKKHCEKCNMEASRIWNLEDDRGTVDSSMSKRRHANDYVELNPPTVDPHMSFDYNGTTYYVSGPYGLMDEEE